MLKKLNKTDIKIFSSGHIGLLNARLEFRRRHQTAVSSTETMVNDNDFDHNTSSLLNGSNNEAVRRGDITFEPEDGEQKTQDDGDVMQFNLEQTDESTQ